ncbi:YbaB/EbfC family nucleoid-associated protein [Nocardia sp. NPDC052566]|uniref:YbaB/EbfC family nucleoid-associated protein n=1 Tax=Nocardia sp. NPDC052566 TaxID=3364330 RepID=UPI0037C62D5D
MTNEHMKSEMAAARAALDELLGGIDEVARQRAALTATAAAYDGRITITVNANGIPIDARFSEEIDELSYEEIAAAIPATAQAAAAEVARRSEELMRPLLAHRQGLPRLSDLIPGAPDFEDYRAPMGLSSYSVDGQR